MNRPLVPSDVNPARALPRAALALALNRLRPEDGTPDELIARHWPGDRYTATVLRTAVSPSSTAITAISPNIVASFVSGLRGQSAAAELIARGLKIDLSGSATATIPRGSTNPAPGWVLEGSPIPIGQPVLTSSTLGPVKKLALIETATAELLDQSVESAEAVITTLLQEAVALQLDTSMFDASAADTTRPAGILAGINAISATSGGGVDALAGDIASLLDTLTTAGAGRQPVLFMAPARRARALILAGAGFDVPIVPLTTLVNDQLLAVDSAVFASAFSATPEISTSRESVLHMDTAPIALSSSPLSVAAPMRSMFQTDTVAIRCILRAAWALRAPACAWIDGATW